jgi:hypothetical protein
MTYHAPELLLVGAAQNVVLVGSHPRKEPAVCDREIAPPEQALYDVVDTW